MHLHYEVSRAKRAWFFWVFWDCRLSLIRESIKYFASRRVVNVAETYLATGHAYKTIFSMRCLYFATARTCDAVSQLRSSANVCCQEHTFRNRLSIQRLFIDPYQIDGADAMLDNLFNITILVHRQKLQIYNFFNISNFSNIHIRFKFVDNCVNVVSTFKLVIPYLEPLFWKS